MNEQAKVELTTRARACHCHFEYLFFFSAFVHTHCHSRRLSDKGAIVVEGYVHALFVLLLVHLRLERTSTVE